MPFVVLDNLESADQLHPYLPRQTDSCVVATCRVKGHAPPEDCVFIEVEKMLTHEAIAMATGKNASLSAADLNKITSAFDGYPLVINYVSAFVARTRLSVSDVCEEIKSDPLDNAFRINTKEGRSLLAVLRCIVQQVKKSDDLAYLIMLLSVYSSLGLASQKTLTALVRVAEPKTSTTRISQALLLLTDFSLLSFAQDDQDDFEIGQPVRLHPFTTDILRDEFRSELPKVIELAVLLFRQSVELANHLPIGKTSESEQNRIGALAAMSIAVTVSLSALSSPEAISLLRDDSTQDRYVQVMENWVKMFSQKARPAYDI